MRRKSGFFVVFVRMGWIQPEQPCKISLLNLSNANTSFDKLRERQHFRLIFIFCRFVTIRIFLLYNMCSLQVRVDFNTTIAYKGGHFERDLLGQLGIPSVNLECFGYPKAEKLFSNLECKQTCGNHTYLLSAKVSSNLLRIGRDDTNKEIKN